MSHQKLAEAYYKLLTRIDWSDKLLVDGLREGLNKFLSNWDGIDPFDRYKVAKIELLDNPKYSAPGELRDVEIIENIGGTRTKKTSTEKRVKQSRKNAKNHLQNQL